MWKLVLFRVVSPSHWTHTHTHALLPLVYYPPEPCGARPRLTVRLMARLQCSSFKKLSLVGHSSPVMMDDAKQRQSKRLVSSESLPLHARARSPTKIMLYTRQGRCVYVYLFTMCKIIDLLHTTYINNDRIWCTDISYIYIYIYIYIAPFLQDIFIYLN